MANQTFLGQEGAITLITGKWTLHTVIKSIVLGQCFMIKYEAPTGLAAQDLLLNFSTARLSDLCLYFFLGLDLQDVLDVLLIVEVGNEFGKDIDEVQQRDTCLVDLITGIRMLHTHLYLSTQILEFTITLLTQWFINPLNNIEVRLPVFLGALFLTSHHFIGIEESFRKKYLLL